MLAQGAEGLALLRPLDERQDDRVEVGVVLKPEAGGARRFAEGLRDNGILAKETHEHVIRFAPPLVIDKETIDWALPAIRDVLNIS